MTEEDIYDVRQSKNIFQTNHWNEQLMKFLEKEMELHEEKQKYIMYPFVDWFRHNGDDSLNKSRLMMTLLPFSRGEEEGDCFGESFWAASVMAESLCCKWRFPIFIFRCFSVSNWVYRRLNSSWNKGLIQYVHISLF